MRGVGKGEMQDLQWPGVPKASAAGRGALRRYDLEEIAPW